MHLANRQIQPTDNTSTIPQGLMTDTVPPNGTSNMPIKLSANLLYYARAIDPALLVAFITLISSISIAKSMTMTAVNHLLDYCAPDLKPLSGTTPQICISRYTAMRPTSPSPKRNHALVDTSTSGSKIVATPHHSPPPHSTVLKQVVSSIAEADSVAVFVNTKAETVTRTTLTERGHPQEATYLKTTTPQQIASSTRQSSQSAPRPRACILTGHMIGLGQGKFDVSWVNMVEYFTTNYSTTHHKRMYPYYLHSAANPMIFPSSMVPLLRGCVDICTIPRPVEDHTIPQVWYIHTPIIHTTNNTSTAHESHRNVVGSSGIPQVRPNEVHHAKLYAHDTGQGAHETRHTIRQSHNIEQ
jgi:hypothetical protein